MTAATETKAPCAIECQDALNNIKQCLGVLFCIMGATNRVDPEDCEAALGLATAELQRNLQTARNHFGMDKKERAAS
jgi:hypothetical protein